MTLSVFNAWYINKFIIIINSKNFLAVNSVCMCVFMFNIVLFMLSMVSMIMSILVYFHLSVLLTCWLLLQFHLRFDVWSIWFSYNCFTLALSESISDWSTVPNKKLNRPPIGIRNLLNLLLLLFRVWSIMLKASSLVVLISVIATLISSRVILNRWVYCGPFILEREAYVTLNNSLLI